MQLLTFMLNDIRFGVPVEDVESIENRMDVVGVPNAPAHFEGIIHLHGGIIPILNLAGCFGYPKQEIRNIIVTNMNGTKIGLEVASVREIIDVNEQQLVPMPSIVNEAPHCFPDVASYNKELIVLLDVANLVPQSTQQEVAQLVEDSSKKTH